MVEMFWFILKGIGFLVAAAVCFSLVVCITLGIAAARMNRPRK